MLWNFSTTTDRLSEWVAISLLYVSVLHTQRAARSRGIICFTADNARQFLFKRPFFGSSSDFHSLKMKLTQAMSFVWSFASSKLAGWKRELSTAMPAKMTFSTKRLQIIRGIVSPILILVVNLQIFFRSTCFAVFLSAKPGFLQERVSFGKLFRAHFCGPFFCIHERRVTPTAEGVQ